MKYGPGITSILCQIWWTLLGMHKGREPSWLTVRYHHANDVLFRLEVISSELPEQSFLLGWLDP